MTLRTEDAFGVAMVIPLQGAGGIFGPSCRAVAELAAHELNADGGILGRPVDLTFIDAGQQPATVASQVAELVRHDVVHAVTGWHISPVRDALFASLRGNVPYVYTALYEGGESRPGVFSSGEVPTTQVAPAMRWLRDNCGVRDWTVVGDDYSWPRDSARFVRDVAPDLGVEIRGASYAEMGNDEAIVKLVDELEKAPTSGVAMFFVGHDAVVFNREFARRGLDEHSVRYSPMMDEAMLLASGFEATNNLFSSAGYYRSLINADTLDLQGRYSAFHGPFAPALTNTAESCYEGLITLATLLRKAASTDMASVNRSIVGLAYDGPRGVVEYHGPQGIHHVHLAKADGLDFEVIAAL
ncbi:substrate-binding domain-containing protein [Gordonia westfalica]|uniref:Substrate-binding domain-containing protein n=1 Tax=Gordonia westfalica TaxID=158898 RepID=A0ABU2GWJ1_9ACTN|nr:substrate-binding domain-containing protein [Gordonia westfalica]MDS1115275.1 substrate-binding domain-containing protein [Gordonia westfalica]